MASWEGSSVTSNFDASSFSQTRMDERSGSREKGDSSISGRSSGFIGIGASGYDIVGLDANQVENMRNAIRDYVQAIENYLNGVDPTANSDVAFRSEEVKAAVQSYITRVKDYCIGLTSQLLAFSDKLGDVKNAWDARAKQLADTVSTSTSGFSDTSKYTETIQ